MKRTENCRKSSNAVKLKKLSKDKPEMKMQIKMMNKNAYTINRTTMGETLIDSYLTHHCTVPMGS